MKFVNSVVGCSLGISLYKLGAALVVGDIGAARTAAVLVVLFLVVSGLLIWWAVRADVTQGRKS